MTGYQNCTKGSLGYMGGKTGCWICAMRNPDWPLDLRNAQSRLADWLLELHTAQFQLPIVAGSVIALHNFLGQ